MIKVKLKIILELVVLWVFLFISPVFAATVANAAALDKVVAVVNTDVITQKELDKRINLMKRQFGNVDNAKDATKLHKRALEDLIDISLQLQLAKRIGIGVRDQELNEIITGIAKSHNITVDKLKEVLPEQEGMSFVEFRKKLREQGIVTRLQQQALGREITVSAKEVDAVLRNPPRMENVSPQYHVVDILFATEENSVKEEVDDIENVARQVFVELQDNADIDKVIKEHQDSVKEGIRSEDLGWRRIKEFPEVFAQEVAKMKVNQVVGPIQAPNGFHLLKLLAINGLTTASSKLTRAQAADFVFQRKLAEKLGPWLKELRESAYIKIK